MSARQSWFFSMTITSVHAERRSRPITFSAVNSYPQGFGPQERYEHALRQTKNCWWLRYVSHHTSAPQSVYGEFVVDNYYVEKIDG